MLNSAAVELIGWVIKLGLEMLLRGIFARKFQSQIVR